MMGIMGKEGRRRLISFLVQKAQRRYFVGTELDDAVRAHDQFQTRGLTSTLGYWDESGDTQAKIVGIYRRVIDVIAEKQADSYVSIKPWAFSFDGDLFREIALHARERGVLIHMDSLQWEWADRSLGFLEQYGPQGVRIGCTLPARWRRSVADAERAERFASCVRIVKGQCAAPPDEAVEPHRGYEAVAGRLAGGAVPLRIATHDPVLARRVLRMLQGRSGVELELLYGLPMRQVVAVASEFGVPVRIYIPFGYGYLPYSLATLKRSPRIAWWLLKDALIPEASPLRDKSRPRPQKP